MSGKAVPRDVLMILAQLEQCEGPADVSLARRASGPCR